MRWATPSTRYVTCRRGHIDDVKHRASPGRAGASSNTLPSVADFQLGSQHRFIGDGRCFFRLPCRWRFPSTMRIRGASEGRQGDSRGLRRRPRHGAVLYGCQQAEAQPFCGARFEGWPGAVNRAALTQSRDGHEKQAPPSGRLNASTVPSTHRRPGLHDVSPSPVPPCPRLRDGSPR